MEYKQKMPIKGVPFLALKKKKIATCPIGVVLARYLMAFGWINAGLLAVLFVYVKGEGCC